jgi:hypothetical protein
MPWRLGKYAPVFLPMARGEHLENDPRKGREKSDLEWLMIDFAYIKVHSHVIDARGGKFQPINRIKGS